MTARYQLLLLQQNPKSVHLLIPCVWISPKSVLWITHLHSGLIWQGVIPEAALIAFRYVSNISDVAVFVFFLFVFIEKKRSLHPFQICQIFQYFPFVLSITLTFNILTKSCLSLRWISIFQISLSLTWSDVRVNFPGHPHIRRPAIVLRISILEMSV